MAKKRAIKLWGDNRLHYLYRSETIPMRYNGFIFEVGEKTYFEYDEEAGAHVRLKISKGEAIIERQTGPEKAQMIMREREDVHLHYPVEGQFIPIKTHFVSLTLKKEQDRGKLRLRYELSNQQGELMGRYDLTLHYKEIVV